MSGCNLVAPRCWTLVADADAFLDRLEPEL